MRYRRCLLAAAIASTTLAGVPSLALDMGPPELQRAQEFGAAAIAADRAFDDAPIEGIVLVRDRVYRVWSSTCSAEVSITYGFDEQAPLSPPDATAEVRNMRCKTRS